MAKDPYKYFRIEARELSEELTKGLMLLEKAENGNSNVSGLLRAAHTLKGAARVVKQIKIADLAHAIEDGLGPQRDAAGPIPSERVDMLLGLVDGITAELSGLDGAPTGDTTAPREPHEEAFRGVRADVEEVELLVETARETKARFASLRRAVSPVEHAKRLADELARQLAMPGRDPAKLVEHTRSSARELTEVLSSMERAITRSVDQTQSELDALHDSAEKLRLIPAHLLLDTLERITRDAAQVLNKQVIFGARGGDVRLDGHLLSIVQSALVQVARNALAHGIESAEERLRAGKSVTGRFEVHIERRGGRVAFRCRDDGRGIDLEAVRRAAERSGIPAEETATLDAEDLFGLLLKGGISTSSKVNEVSGRGVGLDVVRNAAARLGGQVRMRSERGQGTTIELIVPLTLSSLDAVVLEAETLRAAIPLDAVRTTLRVTAQELAKISTGDAVIHAGKAIPFLPLEQALGFENHKFNGPWSVAIVESAAKFAAVGAARLVGTTNIVLRALPPLAPSNPVVAGSTLDAEGTPELVLDPDGLVARVNCVREANVVSVEVEHRVLVVDDSPTTRMLEQSILESAGYAVDLATSAEEGLVKAQNKPYALFLVDVEMPGMDGFEFVKRVRADGKLRDVPAILVTSRNAPEDRKRGFDAGAQGYVVKGEFDQSKLLDQIGRLLA